MSSPTAERIDPIAEAAGEPRVEVALHAKTRASSDAETRSELVAFRRMHGLGNDYVFLAESDAARFDRRTLAIGLSDRHFGVGGDGVITVEPLEGDDAALRMRMWNADGSESGMCGNGLRCAVRFAMTGGLGERIAESLRDTLRAGKPIRVRIGRGIVAARPFESPEGAFEVEIDLGVPTLAAGEIPVVIEGVDAGALVLGLAPNRLEACRAAIDLPREQASGGSLADLVAWSCVSMGNPHLVLEFASVEAVERFDLARLGPAFEHAGAFPQRINVHAVAAIDPQRFRMRTWERGSGITMACGSGACASFVALRDRGSLGDHAIGELPGGRLRLAVTPEGSILMRGEAFESCRGTVAPKAILDRLELRGAEHDR